MNIVAVAKQAGVSKSTVSRVINTPETVSSPLLRKVQAAMRALDYTPPLVRRGPKRRVSTKRGSGSGVIGLLLLGRTRELLAFPLMARIASAMVEALAEHKLLLTVIEVPDPIRLAEVVDAHALSGLMVISPSSTLVPMDALRSIPCVWQGGIETGVPIMDHVLANHQAMGHIAADYLQAKGCQRMAFLNHDAMHPAFGLIRSTFVQRLSFLGHEATCFEPESPAPSFQSGAWALRTAVWEPAHLRIGLKAQVDRLLLMPQRPDGLFFPTDQQAAMACALLREQGVVVGRDFESISTNNDSVWLATLHPRPATIDPGGEEMGREAVRCLLARMRDPHKRLVTVMVVPKLVSGE